MSDPGRPAPRLAAGAQQAPSRRGRSLWLGVTLLLVGLLGLLFVPWLSSPGTSYFTGPYGALPSRQTFSSLGERIFLSGTDEQGDSIPRSTGGMMSMMFAGAGCAGCHGSDGRGRRVGLMMGSFTTPDIRWSALTSSEEQHAGGEPHAPYDEASFTRALQDGIEPDGDRLEAPMPQWGLTDDEVAALVTYLKSLN